MNPFYDYLPKLIEFIDIYKPRRVFEYGVGLNTIMIAKLYPEIKFVSIEYSFKWYLINEICRILRGAKNLSLTYISEYESFINYSQIYPRSYDLFILDSPVDYNDRRTILDYIKRFKKPVLVHDAQHVIPGCKDRTRIVRRT